MLMDDLKLTTLDPQLRGMVQRLLTKEEWLLTDNV